MLIKYKKASDQLVFNYNDIEFILKSYTLGFFKILEDSFETGQIKKVFKNICDILTNEFGFNSVKTNLIDFLDSTQGSEAAKLYIKVTELGNVAPLINLYSIYLKSTKRASMVSDVFIRIRQIVEKDLNLFLNNLPKEIPHDWVISISEEFEYDKLLNDLKAMPRETLLKILETLTKLNY